MTTGDKIKPPVELWKAALERHLAPAIQKQPKPENPAKPA